MTSYERPEPHPVFKAIGDRVPREPLSIIEGFVCPSAKGVLSLVPDLSMSTRFDIPEDAILYVEADTASRGKVRAFVPEATTVSVRQFADDDISVKAEEVAIAQEVAGSSDSMALALAIGGGFGAGGSQLDCFMKCNRQRRKCEGLFPNPKKTRECTKKYNKCRKSCIDKEDQVFSPA